MCGAGILVRFILRKRLQKTEIKQGYAGYGSTPGLSDHHDEFREVCASMLTKNTHPTARTLSHCSHDILLLTIEASLAVPGEVGHAVPVCHQHRVDHDPVHGAGLVPVARHKALFRTRQIDRLAQQRSHLPPFARDPLWHPAVPQIWGQGHVLHWPRCLVCFPSFPSPYCLMQSLTDSSPIWSLSAGASWLMCAAVMFKTWWLMVVGVVTTGLAVPLMSNACTGLSASWFSVDSRNLPTGLCDCNRTLLVLSWLRAPFDCAYPQLSVLWELEPSRVHLSTALQSPMRLFSPTNFSSLQSSPPVGLSCLPSSTRRSLLHLRAGRSPVQRGRTTSARGRLSRGWPQTRTSCEPFFPSRASQALKQTYSPSSCWSCLVHADQPAYPITLEISLCPCRFPLIRRCAQVASLLLCCRWLWVGNDPRHLDPERDRIRAAGGRPDHDDSLTGKHERPRLLTDRWYVHTSKAPIQPGSLF